MKALAMAHTLASAFSEAQGFTDSTHQNPAMKNVLLKADKGALRLTGSNIATGYTTLVEAQVGEGGALVVPRELADILKTCEGQVSLMVEKDVLQVKAEGFRGSFKGLPAEDYPPLPSADKIAGKLQVDASLLEAALALTTIAAGSDDGRITSNLLMRFKPADGKLTLMATDGYRFSIATIAGLKMSLQEQTDVLIPARSAVSLRRPLKALGKDPATLALTADQKLLLYGGAITWFASQAQGTFPDLSPILPKQAACTLAMPTGDLLQACKRLQAVARLAKSKKDSSTAFSLDPGAGTLLMDSSADEAGSGRSVVKPTFGQGSQPTSVRLNIAYLIDALAAVQALGASTCQVSFPPEMTQPITVTASLSNGPANLMGFAQLAGN